MEEILVMTVAFIGWWVRLERRVLRRSQEYVRDRRRVHGLRLPNRVSSKRVVERLINPTVVRVEVGHPTDRDRAHQQYDRTKTGNRWAVQWSERTSWPLRDW